MVTIVKNFNDSYFVHRADSVSDKLLPNENGIVLKQIFFIYSPCCKTNYSLESVSTGIFYLLGGNVMSLLRQNYWLQELID
jgi:hypothetical protein